MHTFTHTLEMPYPRKPVHLVALIVHWLGNYRGGPLVLPMGRVGHGIQRKASSKKMPMLILVNCELEQWGPLAACAWHKLRQESLQADCRSWGPTEDAVKLSKCCIFPDQSNQLPTGPSFAVLENKDFNISCHFGVCVCVWPFNLYS